MKSSTDQPAGACHGVHQALLRWGLLVGLLLLALFLLWEQGLLAALISTDRSHLSIVILSVFGLATLHAGWGAWRLGRETCEARGLLQHLREEETLYEDRDGGLLIARATAERSHAHQHLALLFEKARHDKEALNTELLLERLDQRVRGGHRSGWFIADMMLKLGLLGTVIGFIFMLSSVSDLPQLDIHAMQQLLTTMSGGMRVALYTTLSGLTAGILLGLQYQLLDRAADELIGLVIEITEVYLPRHLNNG